jgi:hypothetical protein
LTPCPKKICLVGDATIKLLRMENLLLKQSFGEMKRMHYINKKRKSVARQGSKKLYGLLRKY